MAHREISEWNCSDVLFPWHLSPLCLLLYLLWLNQMEPILLISKCWWIFTLHSTAMGFWGGTPPCRCVDSLVFLVKGKYVSCFIPSIVFLFCWFNSSLQQQLTQPTTCWDITAEFSNLSNLRYLWVLLLSWVLFWRIDLSLFQVSGLQPIYWLSSFRIVTVPTDWFVSRCIGLLAESCWNSLAFQVWCFQTKLTGTLPPEWSSLASLQRLSLSSNETLVSFRQSGHRWASWMRCNTIDGLLLVKVLNADFVDRYIPFNKLTGPLPSEWSAMSSLTDL